MDVIETKTILTGLPDIYIGEKLMLAIKVNLIWAAFNLLSGLSVAHEVYDFISSANSPHRVGVSIIPVL